MENVTVMRFSFVVFLHGSETKDELTYQNTKFHSASYKIILVNIKSNEDENN